MTRLFCIVAAIAAAALADPFMEFVSNAGFFGRCNCTDHSNLDVIPALCVSLVLGAGMLALRLRELLVRYLLDRGAVAGPPGRLLRLVPAIFALQLAVLFAMETIEQIIVTGHVLGGTIWLGGPVAVSLAVHGASALVVTFAIDRGLRASTKTAIRIILLLVLATSGRGPGQTFARLRYPASFRRSAAFDPRIGERGPPLLTA